MIEMAMATRSAGNSASYSDGGGPGLQGSHQRRLLRSHGPNCFVAVLSETLPFYIKTIVFRKVSEESLFRLAQKPRTRPTEPQSKVE